MSPNSPCDGHGLPHRFCRRHVALGCNSHKVFPEMFKSSYYQHLSFSQRLAHTPPELVMAHLNIDKAIALRRKRPSSCHVRCDLAEWDRGTPISGTNTSKDRDAKDFFNGR